ncbi:MAG: metallophosphoesterase [Candidatus Omnitrophota bacterium]|nr:metallophosphoesterase [Candidatus Omnitrophota bacterium]
MRILVISDTHIPLAAKKLPAIIEEEAKGSDCCLHAGDFVSNEVFEALSRLTKTYAVYGNMDNSELKKKLPEKESIDFEGVRLGLIHGRGSPVNLIDCIKREFSEEFKKLDIVVFGHSHYPLDKEIDKKIYFNPGSPTDKVFTPYCSYGILEIEGKVIKRRIVKIE